MNEYPDDAAYAALLDSHVVRHTVNFTYESPGEVRAGGSGVLAFIGNVRGVLTCGHVLRAIRSHEVKPGQGLLGIGVNAVRGSELQAIKMAFDEIRECPAVVIGGDGGRDNVMGPDLGFLRLPASKWNALSALGSPLDLQPQIALNAQKPPTDANEYMVLATGVPHEMIGKPTVMYGIDAIPLTTSVLPGVLHNEPPNGVYDRIRLEPAGGENYPKSYEGVSGGGIWGVAFRREGKALSIIERRLMGVAYFQTEPDDKCERQLIGHGPGSIYRYLMPQITALENEPIP